MDEVEGRGRLSRTRGEVVDEAEFSRVVRRLMDEESEILKYPAIMELLDLDDVRQLKRAIENGLPGRFLYGDDIRTFRTTKSKLLRWIGGEDFPPEDTAATDTAKAS